MVKVRSCRLKERSDILAALLGLNLGTLPVAGSTGICPEKYATPFTIIP